VSQAQIALLLPLLAIFLFATMLFAFWARRFIGLAPLFMVLGINEGFKYSSTSQVTLQLYGADVFPSGAIFFSASLTMALVLYVREGVGAVRPVAWCIAACGLFSGIVNELLLLLWNHDTQSQIASTLIWRQLVGTCLLFVDIIALIVLTARWRQSMNVWLAMFLVSSLIVAIDGFVYSALAVSAKSLLMDTTIKIGFVSLFLGMAWAYFHWIEKHSFTRAVEAFDDATIKEETVDLLSALTLRHNSSELFRDIYQDELTGAYNRRFLKSWFPEQAKIDANRGLSTGLLLIDVDYFKQVNDRYGHAVGDVVLKHIVARMRTRVRRGDAIVRWGGEEFVIVMPSVETHELESAAQALCLLIQDSPLLLDEKDTLALTITIGVAMSDEREGLDLSNLLDIADKRLYQGKRNGRNQVVSRITSSPKMA
jgi:diguanylate cyclase (GGDEF)-like protein